MVEVEGGVKGALLFSLGRRRSLGLIRLGLCGQRSGLRLWLF
jgi:hypothetical protein